jgi:pimeloyl-ACP methyl ester carboxylesterase
MAERRVKTNGIELWTESFGKPGDPPILLVMGASAQGIGWPEELIDLLVAEGRFVIRYDHRDTGQSTCFDFQKNPYTLKDLASDAVGVLDAYGLAAAHLVGASLGGMICQLISILYPKRVLTLTSMLSTPLRTGVTESFQRAFHGQTHTGGLPPPEPRAVQVYLEVASRRPTNRQEAIEVHMKILRALAGRGVPFDEQGYRRRVERIFERARDISAAENHGLVPSPTREQAEALRHLRVPTLIIHGTDDPMFPPAHGIATAEAIPGAKLLMLEGLGHDLPRALHGEFARAILEHTGPGA